MKKQAGFITLSLLLSTSATAVITGGGGAPPAPRPAANPAPTVRPAPAACKNLAQLVTSDPNFSILATALNSANLLNTLQNGSFTVFAPTDAAFDKLPSDVFATILEDPAMLRNVLLKHVIANKWDAKTIVNTPKLQTLQGAKLAVSAQGNQLMVDDAGIIKANVAACNGVIHVIDTVLMPPVEAVNTPTSTETAAEVKPEAAPTPSIAAFSIKDIPATFAGGSSTNTDSTDTSSTDTSSTDTTATTSDTEMAMDNDSSAEMNITANSNSLDVINTDARFSTLSQLITSAGLTDTLSGDNYTIIAPTNFAFDGVDQETLDALGKDPELLKQVLNYHVIAGKMGMEELVSAGIATTEEGSDLSFAQTDGVFTVDNTSVSQAITTNDGMIYVVDQVLMPTSMTTTEDNMPTEETAMTDTAMTDMTDTPLEMNVTATGNMVNVLSNDSRFSTLTKLINDSGLASTLSDNDYSIVAPTNLAFEGLDQDTLSALAQDSELLKKVLNYHVIPNKISTEQLISQGTIKSAQSSDLAFGNQDDVLMINDVAVNQIITTDKGLIYVVDQVLMPDDITLP